MTMAFRANKMYAAVSAIIAASTLGGAVKVNAEQVLELEEVIVSAEYRAESIQDLSLAITAIDGDELLKTGIIGIEEAITTMPSVEERTGRGDGGFFIRGVGSRFGGIDAGVATYVDGVYQSRGNVTNFATVDVSDVSVLRGPQGTLYGRGANGGAINLVTNNPVIGEVEGYISAGLGNYSNQHIEGAVNIPLGEKLALRAAAVKNQRDGFLDNDLDDADSQALRVKLLAEPNEDLSVLMSVEYFENNAKGYGNVFLPAEDWIGIPYENTPFPFFAPVCGGLEAEVGPPGGPTETVQLPDCDPSQETENLNVTAQLNYNIDEFANLTVIAAYQDFSNNYTQVFSGVYEEGDVPLEQTSLEARLVSNTDGAIEWVAGVFWMEHDLSGFRTEGTFGQTSNDQSVNTTQAVYGQSTFNVSENLRLIAGLRYTEEEDETLLSTVASETGETVFLDEPQDASKVTWKFGAEMDLGDSSLLYATVSTGFTRGGTDLSQFTGLPYRWEEETVTAYEIGSKNQLFDKSLQLNAAIFYYDWEDYHLDFPFGSLEAGTFETRTQNVDGSTSIFGVEVEGAYLISEQNSMEFSATYNKSEFADGEIFINGVQDFLGNDLDPVDMGGIQLAYAPEFTANLSFSQNIFEGLEAKIALDYNDGYWTAIERFNTDGSQNNSFNQGSYTLWNATLTYEPADGNYSVSVYGKNLTDEVIVGQANSAGPNVVGVLQNPRTYGITARYNF
jgi:iron complex outermembrane receptor protein